MQILNNDLLNNRAKTTKEQELENYFKYHNSTLNQQLMVARQDWEITNALSIVATNSVEWLPIRKDERVLEIGGKYGNITEMLSNKAGEVWTLENDFIKCQMIEGRTGVNANTTALLGCIEDIAELNIKFTKIYVVGVLNSIDDYLSSEDFNGLSAQEYALKKLTDLLEDKGELIIADDNRLGMKYFNGARLSSRESAFAQIEKGNADNNRYLFSKKEIENILKGMSPKFEYKFYYPYPDYKYCDIIFSDGRLPNKNELDCDSYCWEEYGYNSFRDSKVFNSFIDEGLFDRFSNSFLVVISTEEKSDLPVYVKYSNDRNYKFQIKTEIWGATGQQRVVKRAFSNSAIKHIQKMYEMYEKRSLLERQDVSLCHLNFYNNYVSYDYIDGKLLSEIANEYIDKGDWSELEASFERLYDLILDNNRNWYISENFENIFGSYDITSQLHASIGNNIDIILQNVIVGLNNHWTIIDYEWGFDFDIPAEYILWRSIFYLNRNKDKNFSNEIWRERLYRKFEIDKETQDIFLSMEKSFQRYITKGSVPIRELKRRKTNIEASRLGEVFKKKKGGEWIYSRQRIVAANNGRTQFSVKLKYNECDILRVDPCSNKCLIHINSINNGYGVSLPFKTNCSKVCGGNNYLFLHSDPQLVVSDLSKVVDTIEFDYEIVNLPSNFTL